MSGNELHGLIDGSGESIRSFARMIHRDHANISRMCQGKIPVSRFVAEQARLLLRPKVMGRVGSLMRTLQDTELAASR